MANTKAQIKTASKDVLEGLGTCANLSQRIRFLNGKGWSKGDISRFLTKYEAEHHKRDKEVRFQHVRNVLITPLKG